MTDPHEARGAVVVPVDRWSPHARGRRNVERDIRTKTGTALFAFIVEDILAIEYLQDVKHDGYVGIPTWEGAAFPLAGRDPGRASTTRKAGDTWSVSQTPLEAW